MKTVYIPGNSALAICDRKLQERKLYPVYLFQRYVNTITRKMEEGIVLLYVEGIDHKKIFEEKHIPNIGVLGFVNGQEPGEGAIPLTQVFPKENDTLALAFIIQGIYRGDFGECTLISGNKAYKNEKVLQGIHVIHSYTVTAEDRAEKPYEISVETEDKIISRE